MPEIEDTELNERQKREIEYHRKRATEQEALLTRPFSWEVLDRPSRRWWNAYWSLYAYLSSLDLKGKRLLVVGCGYGKDAIRLTRLGAEVYAFDLSAESISIARQRAAREGADVCFAEMPAERLSYEDDFFDYVVIIDILHHVDILQAMQEIRRVARPGARLIISEIYSHSLTDQIRHSALVEKMIYPRMKKFIYGSVTPYITEDERKLTEADVREIRKFFHTLDLEDYFYFLVTRIVPGDYVIAAKADRLLLKALKPMASLLSGRVMLSGKVAS